ncbi:MAG: hypothetical protein ABIR17_12780 [Pseudolysinimonas sp.]|uniref:hypothetical protein n=1 Tax=Pseudolysinimonas sp. TaxID=2680009 RepID=UPI003267C127
MQEPVDPEVQQVISRQFVFIALAAAPSYLAIALVRFTQFPLVGWILLAVSAAACLLLIARATLQLSADQPALRRAALATIAICATSPLVAILTILFLPV